MGLLSRKELFILKGPEIICLTLTINILNLQFPISPRNITQFLGSWIFIHCLYNNITCMLNKSQGRIFSYHRNCWWDSFLRRKREILVFNSKTKDPVLEIWVEWSTAFKFRIKCGYVFLIFGHLHYVNTPRKKSET